MFNFRLLTHHCGKMKHLDLKQKEASFVFLVLNLGRKINIIKPKSLQQVFIKRMRKREFYSIKEIKRVLPHNRDKKEKIEFYPKEEKRDFYPILVLNPPLTLVLFQRLEIHNQTI